MERLTERNEKGIAYTKYHVARIFDGENGDRYIGDSIDKLADYEDAEEQGLLVRLPCPIGTPVFEVYCTGWMLSSGKKTYDIREHRFSLSMLDKSNRLSYMELGTRLFVNREEAEAKLEEMRCEIEG